VTHTHTPFWRHPERSIPQQQSLSCRAAPSYKKEKEFFFYNIQVLGRGRVAVLCHPTKKKKKNIFLYNIQVLGRGRAAVLAPSYKKEKEKDFFL
jgi:hypothetical protein